MIADSTTGEPIPPGPPSPDFGKWLSLALRDPKAREALQYFGREPTAEGLWKVYEVIRADAGGKANIVGKGWATPEEIDGFRSVHCPA